MLHTRRVAPALAWCAVFWRGPNGPLRRTYSPERRRRTVKFEIVTDASPWGLGGFLTALNGTPVRYFSEPLREEDYRRWKLSPGDPAGQAIWEALAVLVALALWAPHAQSLGVRFRVRADSTATLRQPQNLLPGRDR